MYWNDISTVICQLLTDYATKKYQRQSIVVTVICKFLLLYHYLYQNAVLLEYNNKQNRYKIISNIRLIKNSMKNIEILLFYCYNTSKRMNRMFYCTAGIHICKYVLIIFAVACLSVYVWIFVFCWNCRSLECCILFCTKCVLKTLVRG